MSWAARISVTVNEGWELFIGISNLEVTGDVISLYGMASLLWVKELKKEKK